MENNLTRMEEDIQEIKQDIHLTKNEIVKLEKKVDMVFYGIMGNPGNGTIGIIHRVETVEKKNDAIKEEVAKLKSTISMYKNLAIGLGGGIGVGLGLSIERIIKLLT